MTTFLLVHGAWHGGWCWSPLVQELEARGHAARTPTLTGLAERRTELGPHVNLSTHIADVVTAAEALDVERFVLVGHSYGGMVISGAAERLEPRLAGLVYVDAFLPYSGQSCAAIAGAAFAPDGVAPPPPAAVFGIHRPEHVAWVERMMTPHPVNTLLEPIVLSGARERVPSKTYVLAGGSPQPFFQSAHARVAADPSWRACVMETGHHPMLDDPHGLADILTPDLRLSRDAVRRTKGPGNGACGRGAASLP
jgi:pimeloyl-ACP methyl ester carboxylesterase